MTEEIKESLWSFRKFFFREKYRFDQGNSFLVFLNFSLLVVSLSSQQGLNGHFIPVYILAGITATWILGYFLDKIVKSQDAQEKEVLRRSPIWRENFQHHGSQKEKLELLINKLEEIERKLEKKI